MNAEKIAERIVRSYFRPHTRYRGDPHWITARFAGKCSKCGAKIEKGDEAFYYPKTKSLLGKKCGHGQEAEQDFLDMVEVEEAYGREWGKY
jgi:hypothetical protein